MSNPENIPMSTLSEQADALMKEWRCWHCDMVLKNEGEASQHFGERETFEPDLPLCLTKLQLHREKLAAVARAEAAEAENARLTAEIAELRSKIGGASEC